MTLGEYMKTSRENNNKTQRDVSKKFGWTTPQFVSNVERDLAPIPKDKVRKWVKFIGADPAIVLKLSVEQHHNEMADALGLL